MSLKRKHIRHTVVKLLTMQVEGQYVTAAEDRVFANRPTPMFQSELPAICVYIKSEPAEKSVHAPVVYTRKPRIVVEILARADESCDDILDDIGQQVEDILFSNGYLRDPDELRDRLDDKIELESTQIELVEAGTEVCGSNSITFTGGYDTEAPRQLSGDELDDFLTANMKFDLNNDGAADMDNTVTVREE